MIIDLYIPKGTVELGKLWDFCIGLCVDRWGGCTQLDAAIGHWRNPDTGEIVSEPVGILRVVVPQETPVDTVRLWFDGTANLVRYRGEQHSVLYTIDGDPRMIDATTFSDAA